MADDPGDGEAEDERELELSTVAAIYPELNINNSISNPISATISIDVEPVKTLSIRFPAANEGPPGGLPTPLGSTDEGGHPLEEEFQEHESAQDIQNLTHLPPLTLRIVLPKGYPATESPFFSLKSQYSWLPEIKIQELQKAGSSMWEEMGRDQMVFSYIDHLRDMAEQGFGLTEHGRGVLEVSSDLKVALLDFDSKAKRVKFERETFECGICLEPKKGIVCHRLVLCEHVFCVPCLQDFYNASITEGDIGNIKCMTPDCGSKSQLNEDRSLEPSELLQIPLEQEIIQRYVKLKRKNRLESDRSTIYCPRQWCQGPAKCPNKKTTGDEPREYDRNTNQDLLPPPAERLAICEDCTFAFCKVCKASWHGEYFVCFPRAQFELTAEEKASEDYMMLHTQPCPTCDARAQKTHGCNHMICFKCNTHFCYLCGAYLDKGNPYAHYNTRKSGCYMRLWELEGGDDGEIGQAFGGGRADLPLDHDSDDEDEIVPDPPHPLLPPLIRQYAPLLRPAPAAPVAHNVAPGLQRFLQMVQNDEEDDWDSDEMDESDEDLEQLG